MPPIRRFITARMVSRPKTAAMTMMISKMRIRLCVSFIFLSVSFLVFLILQAEYVIIVVDANVLTRQSYHRYFFLSTEDTKMRQMIKNVSPINFYVSKMRDAVGFVELDGGNANEYFELFDECFC